MADKIIKLSRQKPNPVFAKLEEAAITHALEDIAVLCEVAGVSWADRKPDTLPQFAEQLTTLRRLNIVQRPVKPLDIQELAIYAGAGMVPTFARLSVPRVLNAPESDRLKLDDPATRIEIISRALRDTGAVVGPVAAWLAQGDNRKFGHYFAAGENAAQLFLKPELDIEKEFDGLAIFRRVNAALQTHGLTPLPLPFAPPPPRSPDGRPNLRPV